MLRRVSLCSVLAAAWLVAALYLRAQSPDLQSQIAALQQKLAAARAANNPGAQAVALNQLGFLYWNNDQSRQALGFYSQALALVRQINDHTGEAIVLGNIGQAYYYLSEPQKALEAYNQALPLEREVHNRAAEAITLDNIGEVYAALGQPAQALDFYKQALPIRLEVGDHLGEAITLNDIGLVERDTGQPRKALESFNQALVIQRTLANRNEQANTLGNIGVVYRELGEPDKALDFLNQSLSIRHELGDRSGQEGALNNIGAVYWDSGDTQHALASYNQALVIARDIGDRSGEETMLGNLGAVYAGTGRPQLALDFYNQALAMERSITDRVGEATTLANMGLVYRELGQPQRALEYLNQALPIERAVGDRSGEATTLSNIGNVYAQLDQPPHALDFFNQALAIERAIENRRGEAITISLIGLANFKLGQTKTALEFYRQALAIARTSGVRLAQGYTLARMGIASGALGDSASELSDEAAALALSREIGDPEMEGLIDTTLMHFFSERGRPSVAILFGANAVDTFQQIRRNMTGLDKDLQTGFAQSKSSTYRELAELLVAKGRLAEAERVLDLLKDAELKETVRGAANTADNTDPLPQTEAERAAETALATKTSNADSLTHDAFEFDRLSALPNPTEAEKSQLKLLAGQIAIGNAATQDFFNKTLYNELGGDAHANARASSADTETSSLSNLLAELGPGTLALYTLVGEQHSYIIVSTPTTRTRYELHTTAAALGKLVLMLREELRTPASDPSKDLATLSHILLDPIAADLAAAAKQSPDGIPTLLWSLDGVLRYVPMNALFESTFPSQKKYLLERARNVVVTPESRNHLLETPGAAELRAAAFGVSQSYLGLHELSGVPAELDAVVHDPAVSASHGPLAGKLLRDDAFTLAALESTLRQHYPVVHIASHFVFQAGNSGESYLLLSGEDTGGKGFELTMSQLQTDPLLSFRGTRLLTLSACSTAEADTTGNGREIDSLGMVMQKRDASAVLATLWDVNDASTSVLMSDFYRRWATTPGIAKIEALRQAQIAMLRGTNTPTHATTSRGTQVESAPPTNTATYAHPYYWAPFVLIGNYR